MSDKVTEKERELIKLLKEKEPEKNFVLGVCLFARQNGNIDKVIQYIKQTPEATADDIFEFSIDN